MSAVATIAKAAVTLAGASANNKVYDTTTNASIASNGSATVVLGNSTLANGSLNTSTAFTNYTVSGAFANASAGNQAVNLTTALGDSTNYTVSGASQTTANATISKAAVTLAGASANNKVYDTTTNASIASNGSATVVLGNSTLANGSLNSSTAFTNYTVSGAFANASAGNQAVNLTTALGDSTNYTISGSSQTTTVATIAKANVTLNIAAIANNKVYDTTTNASLASNSSGVVQLGNATAANGSLAANTSFAASGVASTGAFNNASAGTQTVALNNALIDTANYTLVAGRTLNTSATIAKANVFLNVPGIVSDKPSVCTGSLILGAAGLLSGYKATSHWMTMEALPELGAIPTKGRVVVDRNRITGGGVTAGIDFGLLLIGILRNREYAQAVQLYLEYDPDPPFNSGSPNKAPKRVRSFVFDMMRSAQEFSIETAKKIRNQCPNRFTR